MYRDCRNLCQTLRALGYARLVSIENFKRPNFELVTDILYWLAKRFDPAASFSDRIELENDRVEFIKNICLLFSRTTRLKLNPKKLYQADSAAVEEILKITTILYKAYSSTTNEDEESAEFTLTSKVGNLKAHKQLAIEINDIGTKLYDLISKEPELKQHRTKALAFLDGVGGSKSQEYIEACVKEKIKQQEENMQEITKYVTNLEKEQRTLEDRIRKKTTELDRAEKKLQTMTSVKPPHQDEQDRLEQDLERLYQLYAEKFRNLHYLEQELEHFNSIERKENEAKEKRLINERIKIKDDMDRFMSRDIDEAEQAEGQGRAATRKDSRNPAGQHRFYNMEDQANQEDNEEDNSGLDEDDPEQDDDQDQDDDDDDEDEIDNNF